MNPKEAKVKARLEEVLQSIFCPVSGCWCLQDLPLDQPGNGPIKRRHAVPKRKFKSLIEGHWNIVSMTAWDVEETVEELQPFIEFERSDGGQFQFGGVYGEMDCRLTERDGKPAAEFSWEGHDEDEQVFGRGWAIMEGDQLEGMIFFYHGDESGFVAERAEG